MNLEPHAPLGADPRSNARAQPTPRPIAKRDASSTAATPRPTLATNASAAKISVDPMQATDRYRLVMPWSDRV
jgi:hypothetical protein